MTKNDFIEKWNIGYSSKEEKIELAKEMRKDLTELCLQYADSLMLADMTGKELHWILRRVGIMNKEFAELMGFKKQYTSKLYYEDKVPLLCIKALERATSKAILRSARLEYAKYESNQ
jgi:nicotinate-nucleotide pyrophosphorylase